MSVQIVKTLVIKDLTLFFKNQFFAFVTVLGIVAYAGIYYIMPDKVDETLELALFAPSLPLAITDDLTAEGLALKSFDSETALKEAVLAKEYQVGIALPDDFLLKLATNDKPEVNIYLTTDVPPEFRDVYTLLIEELSFLLSGRPLRIDANEEILGVDRAGNQIPPRERMLPLFAVFILMTETLGLASLVSAEVETGTLQALLVTPTNMTGLFMAKAMTGVGLAFVQAAVLMAVTGGLNEQPILILVALLFGSLLATGIGFLMASVSKDMLSVMGWGVLALIILAIPSFNLLLPGLTSNWVQIIPSYYLVDTVHQVSNFNGGWGDVGGNLVVLLTSALTFLGLGIFVLQRKFQ